MLLMLFVLSACGPQSAPAEIDQQAEDSAQLRYVKSLYDEFAQNRGKYVPGSEEFEELNRVMGEQADLHP